MIKRYSKKWQKTSESVLIELYDWLWWNYDENEAGNKKLDHISTA